MSWKNVLERVVWTAVQAAAGLVAGLTFHSPEIGAAVTVLAAIVKNLAAKKLAGTAE